MTISTRTGRPIDSPPDWARVPDGAMQRVSLGPLVLESGEVLPRVRLAYDTWGEFTGDNAVLVLHALIPAESDESDETADDATDATPTDSHAAPTHEAVLYTRPMAGRDSEEFYGDARYGEFWVGRRWTLDEAEALTGLRAAHIDDLRDALVGTGLFSSVSVEPKRTGQLAPDGTEYVDLAVHQTAGPARTLAAEAGSQAVDRDALAVGIASRADQRDLDGAPLSTQEAGWIVLAAQALSQGPDAGGGLMLSGAPLTGAVHDVGDAGALPPVVLGNTGSAPVEVTLGTTAVPVDPPKAGGTAFKIARHYFTEAGLPVDPAQVALGTRSYDVVIEAGLLTRAGERLAPLVGLSDYVAAMAVIDQAYALAAE